MSENIVYVCEDCGEQIEKEDIFYVRPKKDSFNEKQVCYECSNWYLHDGSITRESIHRFDV